jgi:manganese-dependent ADP-ribose/CDP-alcohol diphosphatase
VKPIRIAPIFIAAWSAGRASEEPPLFSFGLIADVQYADKETQGRRRYREALGKLVRAVEELDRHDLIFIADLGDLVDGNGTRSLADLDRVLDAYRRSRHPVLHVIGNHCLAAAGRETILRRYGLERGYRQLSRDGHRFIFLDGMALSLEAPPESETHRMAKEFLLRNPWAGTYSGGLGEEQERWLRSCLEAAARRGEKVFVFCHLPILEGQSTRDLLLWDHEEVSKMIVDSGCVAACFSGHDHAGGYAARAGVHFLTLPGLVEAPEEGNAFAEVEVHESFLIVAGHGTVPHRRLELPMPFPSRLPSRP